MLLAFDGGLDERLFDRSHTPPPTTRRRARGDPPGGGLQTVPLQRPAPLPPLHRRCPPWWVLERGMPLGAHEHARLEWWTVRVVRSVLVLLLLLVVWFVFSAVGAVGRGDVVRAAAPALSTHAIPPFPEHELEQVGTAGTGAKLQRWLAGAHQHHCAMAVEVGVREQYIVLRPATRRGAWRHRVNAQVVVTHQPGDTIRRRNEVGEHCRHAPGFTTLHGSTRAKLQLPTRQVNRHTVVGLRAFDPATNQWVEERLTGDDAFCVQAYADIVAGRWPCVVASE